MAAPADSEPVTKTRLTIRSAVERDVPTIMRFIRGLADYEKLSHEVVADEELLRRNLFGPVPYAEVALACEGETEVGFALFFHNFSTFLGRPGIYLEDLFIDPAYRGKGYGKALLAHLAELAVERDCGRLDWAVLDWNAPAIDFYKSLGAVQMEDWLTFRLTGDALKQMAKQG